jgi:hypothetical protein
MATQRKADQPEEVKSVGSHPARRAGFLDVRPQKTTFAGIFSCGHPATLSVVRTPSRTTSAPSFGGSVTRTVGTGAAEQFARCADP